MDKLVSKLLSMQAMAVGMLIFALSVAVATFIENDFGTATAKAEVYQARWFEVLLIFLAVNLIANMKRFKMYKKPLSMRTIFHASFLIILLGAAVTRYFGYEGTLQIREGETENRMVSTVSYVTMDVIQNNKRSAYEKEVLFSKLSDNTFSQSFGNGTHTVDVKLLEYIPSAVYEIQADEQGKPMAQIMVVSSGGPQTIVLTEGEFFESSDYVLDFGSGKRFMKPVVSILLDKGALFLNHTDAMFTMSMDTKEQKMLPASAKSPFNMRTLHGLGQTRFVLKGFFEKGKRLLVSKEQQVRNRMGMRHPDALKMEVAVNGEKQEKILFGADGAIGDATTFYFGDMRIDLRYGAKLIVLPFAIKLKDFELERYPGSMAPSSYASEVVLIDEAEGIRQDYRIYMNHVLDHKGFRLFQSSYDQDEKGTVLSVNYDFWGTTITYIGYLLLAIGFFGTFFVSSSRFQRLRKELAKLKEARSAVAVAALAVAALLVNSTPLQAQETAKAPTQEEMYKLINAVDKAHADRFGRLMTQTDNGRLEPVDSLNNKILRKVYKKSSFIGLNANQVILGMMTNPNVWQAIPMIKLDNPEIAKLLRIPESVKYASYIHFYPPSMQGDYLLEHYVGDARRKPAKERNRLDKALLKVDEAVHITQMVFNGILFKIFPKQNDENNKWYNLYEVFSSMQPGAPQIFTPEEVETIRQLFLNYFNAIDAGVKNEDFAQADAALDKLASFQKFSGASIYPGDFQISLEIAYNHIDIFIKLMIAFLVIGSLLLVTAFITVLKPSLQFPRLIKGTYWLLGALFVIYTAGLIARWIIAGHAPWSNGYEAIVYIGWATLLAGFLVAKNSLMTFAATALLTGITLLVAMMSNFDPQITNLVPVLKSYWLTIHVSMITASYGFLGLAAILGFIGLILFVALNDDNAKRLSLAIKELNIVAEMAILIGLVLLTVGNFLGGVWANESWGRYWGWDAKETWALVSILVYATVAHIRYIPKFYSDFKYSVIIVVSYSSILMTFFGVNFYLSGLHSYAKGDPVPVPTWVYFFVATIVALIIAAAFRKKRFIK